MLLVVLAALGCAGTDRQEETVARQQVQKAPAGPLRVVAVGDSLAYGAGDERREGIAGRLEDILRQRGVAEVDTENLGSNGASTADLLARLRQPRVRSEIAGANAIVLSIGANDLFRTPGGRDAALRSPLAVAEQILGRIEKVVGEVRALNPSARIFILGAYNPVPGHPWSEQINRYVPLWDGAVAARFEHDERITVVPMADIVTPERLSRYDNFHPGGEAYQLASQRIAELLLEG